MTSIALLLPGQGSQYVGMGRDLADAYPRVREIYEQADEILQTPLSRLSWEGPAEELTATENAQPAILLHSFAAWQLVRSQIEDQVVVAAGHSLGEFTAHLLAGTMELPDALRLVRRRGQLMARSGSERPGTMSAIIGLEPAAVLEICERADSGVVVPANFNAPGQIVISGDVPAVEQAGQIAAAEGAKRVIPLTVSGAFHSPLMEVAAAGLREALDDVSMGEPLFPVVANATAQEVSSPEAARQTLLAQLTSPVRWVDGVRTMCTREPERWLEIGPGRVLSGLLRRIDRSQKAASVGDMDGVEAITAA